MSIAEATSGEQEPFLLKNIFSPALLEGYGHLLASVWPEFDTPRFFFFFFDEAWPALEL